VVLELFCGCGEHGENVANVLRATLKDSTGGRPHVTLIRADIQKQEKEIEMQCDLLSASSEGICRLKNLFPNKRWIVLASPPCQAYSRANTTGKNRLEDGMQEADKRVKLVVDFISKLEAVLGVVENPETGRLKDREVRQKQLCSMSTAHIYMSLTHYIRPLQVIQFFKYNISFDYCCYGRKYRKRTTLWSTENLEYDEVKNPLGFTPLMCQGWGSCKGMISKTQHFPFDKVGRKHRESIPEQVSCSLGVAITSFLSMDQVRI